MAEAPTRKWYFSRKEIECQTPSRFDGITYKQEQHLRKLYCYFLQELGIELKVPQVTIATALMFCHRFYMRQSHAKNDWQTIATVCMFLACKAEETPRSLGELVVVAYKLIFKGDPSASRRIRERYDKQKELIVIGERLLLTTIAFDLNIEHPYKPLVAALKRLGITHNELVKVAWNFVNDWLRTSLCLQHKPHYIAAGSLFLAAKVKKVKLASENGKAWWMEFDVSPKQLEDVIQQMMGLVEQSQNQTSQTEEPKDQNVTESRKAEMVTSSGCSIVQDSKMIPPKDVGGPGKSATSSCVKNRAFGNAHNTSSDSSSANSIVENSKMQASMDPFQAAKFVLSNAIKKQDFHKVDGMSKETPKCQTSDTGSGSAVSVVEDGDSGEPFTAKSDLTSSCKIVGNRQVDVNRIREKLKNRNLAKSMKRKHAEDDMDDEAWIERELEDGIVLETSYPEKKLKV